MFDLRETNWGFLNLDLSVYYKMKKNQLYINPEALINLLPIRLPKHTATSTVNSSNGFKSLEATSNTTCWVPTISTLARTLTSRQ